MWSLGTRGPSKQVFYLILVFVFILALQDLMKVIQDYYLYYICPYCSQVFVHVRWIYLDRKDIHSLMLKRTNWLAAYFERRGNFRHDK